MPDLDFGSTAEETMIILKSTVQRMHGDLYNGDKLISKVSNFISMYTATEIERSRQHKQNLDRLNLLIAALGVLCAILALHLFK